MLHYDQVRTLAQEMGAIVDRAEQDPQDPDIPKIARRVLRVLNSRLHERDQVRPETPALDQLKVAV